jgi:MoxR-like ATPase
MLQNWLNRRDVMTTHENSSVLDALGVYGLAEIEPVILAALAGETPLLLIGEHGSGKSLLLERLAGALKLSWRHYNASLLSFDDLVGYPIPDTAGDLQFVKTPAAIWGAQAVFIDEISRARPEVQNKIFPIIHERRVQGIELPDLVHRWAAMNPPLVDGEGDYIGSEALDSALADRFAFHVTVPGWQSLPEGIQRRILRESQTPAGHEGLPTLLASVREWAEEVGRLWGDQIADYTLRMTAGLAAAGLPVSSRRAVLICRNIALVYAAKFRSTSAHSSSVRLGQSAWVAFSNSLPFTASGRPFEPIKLLALHREVSVIAFAGADDARSGILLERDPVKRIEQTLACDQLQPDERGALVMDAISALDSGASAACAWWLVHSGVHEHLPLAASEDLARIYREAAVPTRLVERIPGQSLRGKAFALFEELSKKTNLDRPAQVALVNFLSSRLHTKLIESPEDLNAVVKGWWRALEELDPPLTIGVA